MSAKHGRVLVSVLLLCVFSTPLMSDNYSQQRQRMIAEIENDVHETADYIQRSTLDQRVMQAMRSIPRHEFIPEDQRYRAYLNQPLPIGHGQTISQPYIVALMTDLLKPQPGQRVLEIGTGSGYQAAVLSTLVDQVFSIEIVEPLADATSRLLTRLGYHNIHTRIADGYDGWPEEAPFDGIIVTAAISHIPPPLVRQLKKGGRMVIPVGTRFQTQQLTLVEKDLQGAILTRQLLPVRFVPFTGGH